MAKESEYYVFFLYYYSYYVIFFLFSFLFSPFFNFFAKLQCPHIPFPFVPLGSAPMFRRHICRRQSGSPISPTARSIQGQTAGQPANQPASIMNENRSREPLPRSRTEWRSRAAAGGANPLATDTASGQDMITDTASECHPASTLSSAQRRPGPAGHDQQEPPAGAPSTLGLKLRYKRKR